MSVDGLNASQAIVLRPAGTGSGGLTLGQVVHASVLRQVDAGRYLVRLAGQEREVDSATPLRPGEVLSLRVAGTRERVELERMDREPAAQDGAGAAPAEELAGAFGGGAASVMEELFRRYRGTLAPAESERLRRLVAAARRPERMALAGLVLSKVGLPVSAELAEPLYEALDARAGALAPLPEVADGESGAPRWWPAAQCTLNAQSGGAVGHRVGRMPVEFGDGVVDVEVALFEERDPKAGGGAAGARHRKFVAVLQTERLGRVELRAAMADRHLRVALATESGESTQALLGDAVPLSRALEAEGWQVDEITHETRAPAAPSAAVAAAVEHLITPGSVSRLA
jgi:hypothetical protein